MNLNKKVLLVVGTTTLILIISFYFSSRTILLNSYETIEYRHARTDLQRVLSALDAEIKTLAVSVKDWAEWDDTYNYVVDENEGFIRSNMVDSTFLSLRLNFILIFDQDGRLRFGKGFDLEEEEEAPVSGRLLEFLSENRDFIHFSDSDEQIRGIVDFSERPLLIASHPILTSERQGPIRGAMLMGRYWTEEETENLARISHTNLDMIPIDQSLPADFAYAHSSLSEDQPYFIIPESEKTLYGFTLIENIQGNPCLMMRMTKTREIYAQAKGSLAYHLASTIIIGLVICTLVYFLIKKLVVGRLVRLADQVSQIDISSEPARRVDALGNDELAFLADSINRMLDHLVQAQQELQESIDHIKTLRGIVPICAHCKNIKDNKGYWKQVEAYIEEHTEAEFSHSLCEKCMRELYPELAEEIMGEEVPPGENKNRE